MHTDDGQRFERPPQLHRRQSTTQQVHDLTTANEGKQKALETQHRNKKMARKTASGQRRKGPLAFFPLPTGCSAPKKHPLLFATRLQHLTLEQIRAWNQLTGVPLLMAPTPHRTRVRPSPSTSKSPRRRAYAAGFDSDEDEAAAPARYHVSVRSAKVSERKQARQGGCSRCIPATMPAAGG